MPTKCTRRLLTAHTRAEDFGHGQCREGIDAQPMSKGFGNAEAKCRASVLDAGHVEIVWLHHRPEGLRGR